MVNSDESLSLQSVIRRVGRGEPALVFSQSLLVYEDSFFFKK